MNVETNKRKKRDGFSAHQQLIQENIHLFFLLFEIFLSKLSGSVFSFTLDGIDLIIRMNKAITHL
jgi:hypothetical protein